MAFEVEVERAFRARQGLPSPLRTARGRSTLRADGDVEMVLRARTRYLAR